MELTIFAKKKTTNEGKTFFAYLSTLTRKDGTKQSVQVKFRESCGAPKPELCPLNIKIDKTKANLSSREFVREDSGETITSFTLWVSAWENGAPYVDHSLDEFI